MYNDINTKIIKSNIIKEMKQIILYLEYEINGHLIKKYNVSKKNVLNRIEDKLRIGKLLS
jgi:hypothetical protein